MNFSKLYSPYAQTGFLANRVVATSLWFGLSLAAVVQQLLLSRINNFIVFRSVYFHLIQQKNLYLFYPAEYADVNLYGPVFGLLIAPFALLPVQNGALGWVMLNVLFLYWAIYKLPVPQFYKIVLIFLCSHELMNNSSWLQSNAFVCGCILLGFSMCRNGREQWAVFFIMLATFVKLYGVIALFFLPFATNRLRFILWMFCWFIIFFFAPLILTSWHFLLQTYQDWYVGLSIKAAKNIRLVSNNYFQDISFMGVLRRSFFPNLKNIFVIVPAILLYLSQFIYITKFKELKYQLYVLCSSLLFVVIFSTGSESPTYMIAIPAICIWFFLQPFRTASTWFFIIAFFVTTFSYSDLLTAWFRHHIAMRYSIKAIPSCILWLCICFQIHFIGWGRDSKNRLWEMKLAV